MGHNEIDAGQSSYAADQHPGKVVSSQPAMHINLSGLL